MLKLRLLTEDPELAKGLAHQKGKITMLGQVEQDMKAGQHYIAQEINENDEEFDKGHLALLNDLTLLLREALAFQFHDFRNEQFATPKVELINRFTLLSESVKNGAYNN